MEKQKLNLVSFNLVLHKFDYRSWRVETNNNKDFNYNAVNSMFEEIN